MTMETQPPALLGSARFNLAIIGLLGCTMMYAMRSDLSLAKVCMVNSTAVKALSNKSDADVTVKATVCVPQDGSETKKATPMGELVWSNDEQGYALGSFYWGYICTQILGGYLANRYGGRLLIGFAILGSSILTLISPLAATANVFALVLARVLMGLMQGAVMPAFHTMWSLWAPPLERSLLTGFTYAGAQIGNIAVMPLSGFLCEYGFAGGWPSIFYVVGTAGALWCVLWFCFVSDRPSSSKRISKKELNYIENSLAGVVASDAKMKPAVPWRSILCSAPVWAAFFGHFAGDWGSYTMMLYLPQFMSDVLGLDSASLGMLAAIPYVAYFILINLGGFVADKLQNANILSVLAIRRLAMIIALGSQAIFLVASGYCSCGQEILVMIFLTLGIGLSGLQYAGFVVNYFDIAPAYAGSLLGVGNTITCFAGIIGPEIVSKVVVTNSQQEWQLVFWITAGILIAGTVVFCLFAKGEVQPWALVDVDDEENCDLEKVELNVAARSANN